MTLLEEPKAPAGSGTGFVRSAAISSPAVMLAASASAAAGLVHAAAAGAHAGDDTLVTLFALAALAQLAWAGVALLTRASRVVLACGVAVNAALVVAWALSRTVGLPVVDALADVEDAGTQDVIAAVLGAVAAGAALVALLGRMRASPSRPDNGGRLHAAGIASVAALVLTVPAITAGHDDHGVTAAGHEHAATEVATVGAGLERDASGNTPDSLGTPGPATTHSHAPAPAAASTEMPAAAAGPIISLDDPRVTAEQRAAAASLIEQTRAGMAMFVDEASVTAAGYRSIGDAPTGFEHFVHWGHLTDGVDLDPNRIESVVFEVAPDGTKRVASAMYILAPPKKMADVPDIAGELTTWHDHQDLCWSPDGRVVGRFRDGACVPEGRLAATPPMLHVWVVEHPCGPFAGIEGHGESCAHA